MKELPQGYRWDHNDNAWWVVRESDGKIIHWVERCNGYYEVIWLRGFPRDDYDTLEHAQEAVRKRIKAIANGGVVAGTSGKVKERYE